MFHFKANRAKQRIWKKNICYVCIPSLRLLIDIWGAWNYIPIHRLYILLISRQVWRILPEIRKIPLIGKHAPTLFNRNFGDQRRSIGYSGSNHNAVFVARSDSHTVVGNFWRFRWIVQQHLYTYQGIQALIQDHLANATHYTLNPALFAVEQW